MFQAVLHAGWNVFFDVRIFNADRRRTPTLLLPVPRGGRGIYRRRSGFGHGLRLDERGQSLLERLSRLRQNHPVLRTLRPRQTRFHSSKIKRKQFRVFGLRSLLIVKESLLTAVSLDQSNLFRAAPSKLQILQALIVDRKNSARRPILR